MATEIERLNIDKELNEKAKEYLRQIKEDYYEYLSDDKKKYLDELITKDNIGFEVATESDLIHELFHHLITPAAPIKYHQDDNMSSYISEGLADLYTIEFMKKRDLFPDYPSDYYGNILFVRDRLDSLPDEESKHQLSFNANTDQIIENTANTPEEFISEYEKAKKYETEYDELLKNIALLSPVKNSEGEYFKGLMRLSARVGKNEALDIIMRSVSELNPYDIENRTPEEIQTFQEQTISAINGYLQKTPEKVK